MRDAISKHDALEVARQNLHELAARLAIRANDTRRPERDRQLDLKRAANMLVAAAGRELR